MSTELQTPDASVVAAVSRDGVAAALQMINRAPLSFGAVEWIDAGQVGDEVRDLLPKKSETLSPEEAREVERLIAHNDGLQLER